MISIIAEYNGGIDQSLDALIREAVGRDANGSGVMMVDALTRDLVFDCEDENEAQRLKYQIEGVSPDVKVRIHNPWPEVIS